MLTNAIKKDMYYYEDGNDIVFVENQEDLPDSIKDKGCMSIYLSNYFENSRHYANFCMKVLKDKFPMLDVHPRTWHKLREVYKAYDYNTFSVDGKICSPPAEKLSMKIKDVNNAKTVTGIFDEYFSALDDGRLHLMNPSSHCNFGDYDIRIPDISLECDIGLDRCGVYFLYDDSKELIYIGKSDSLSQRIYSTAKERLARFCRFGFTEAESDAGIYEIYYICKLNPSLNKEYSGYKKPTIELLELDLTDFYEFKYKNK